MIQRLFVLGASGNVGKEFIRQVITKDTAKNHANPSQIVGIANSKKYCFVEGGIESCILEKGLESKEMIEKILEKSYKNPLEMIDIVQKNGMDGEVTFVDLTSAKDSMLEFHTHVMTQTHNSIVTANKNPISLFSMDDFNVLLKNYGRYNANTTVMAGSGAFDFVNERGEIHDPINLIKGCFSGTLGYVLSEVEKGRKFSQVVRDAKEKGYTEPNPWDDLNGLDVGRKILILARLSGNNIAFKDLKIEPLIDEKYAQYSGEDFLQNIEQEDAKFERMFQEAQKEGKTYRYVATFNNQSKQLQVGLEKVDIASAFGQLKGTNNIFYAETDTYHAGKGGYTLVAAGAGLDVTANSVRVGVAKLLGDRRQRK